MNHQTTKITKADFFTIHWRCHRQGLLESPGEIFCWGLVELGWCGFTLLQLLDKLRPMNSMAHVLQTCLLLTLFILIKGNEASRLSMKVSPRSGRERFGVVLCEKWVQWGLPELEGRSYPEAPIFEDKKTMVSNRYSLKPLQRAWFSWPSLSMKKARGWKKHCEKWDARLVKIGQGLVFRLQRY